MKILSHMRKIIVADLGYTTRDVWNFLSTSTRTTLATDVMTMLKILIKKKTVDANFFYEIKLHDGKIHHVL